MYKHNKSPGFTLVEVLVALMILALAFAAIITSINQNSRNLLHLIDKTAANYVAMNVVAQVQTGLITTNSGQETQMNEDWNWQLQTQATENPYVTEILVTVQKEKSSANIISLTAFIEGTPDE